MTWKPSFLNTLSRLFGISGIAKSSSHAQVLKKDVIAVAEAPLKHLSINDVPGPWPSIPLIGTSWLYFPGSRYSLSTLHEAAEDKFHRYGSIVREEFEWRVPVIHLFNPDDFERVFRHQGRYPNRPLSDFVVHYRRRRPDKYDSPGLANTRGEEWERLRKIISPVLLKPKAVNFMLGGMNAIADDFAQLLRSARNPNTLSIENVQDLAYRLALEGVYMMSLDTRLGCLESGLLQNSAASDMILSVKLLFEAFQELFFGLPLWKLFETSSYKKLDKAETLMYDATSRRIQEAIEKLRNADLADQDKGGVLHTLLQKKELNDKELIVTVIDLISGGVFTVANSLSFLIHHVARNTDVQEKLYQEVTTAMPDPEITQDRLSRMPYLKACVKEAFRLSPTIPGINRILPEDVILSGYRIPAGTQVFCHFPIPCKQAVHFPEPDKFLPDRWLDKSMQNHNPFILVPFGFGTRMCIGKRFAEMEMHMALAKLVYYFRLVDTGKEIKSKSAFILVPTDPVSVILKDR